METSWVQPSPTQYIYIFKSFQKIYDFLVYVLLHFDHYWFIFLYCKDTNPILKYLIFVKTLNFFSCFHAYGLGFFQKIIKKIISYFHTTKIKKFVLACILALITSLLKSRELGQHFKNSKKNLFCVLLISRVLILYVGRIPDIKILLLTLEQLSFTR